MRTTRVVTAMLCWLVFPASAFSQNIADSVFSAGLFTASYSVQFPGGDLVKRFGTNSNISGGFLYKSKGNWLSGVSIAYLFGDKVKEDDIFRALSVPEGYLIDKVGTYAEVYLYERGYHAGAHVGKIFAGRRPNPNSGIMVLLGSGYLQHKIRIENPNKSAPQLQGDYRRGYDRLSGGIYTSQFIGYVYFSNKKVYNFFGGVECMQAWTKSLREYDFDRMAAPEKDRFDLLWGIRVGWVLPFYQKTTNTFYYY